MSTELHKGRQASVETGSAVGWPQWIADALAYKPQQTLLSRARPRSRSHQRPRTGATFAS